MPLLPLTDDELALVDGAGPLDEIIANVNETLYRHEEKVRELIESGGTTR